MDPGATSSSRAGEPGLLSRLIRRASMRRSTGSMAAINNFAATAARRRAPPANTVPTSDTASVAVPPAAATASEKQADEVYARDAGEREGAPHKVGKSPAASPFSPGLASPVTKKKKKSTKPPRPQSMPPTQPAAAMGPSVQSTKLRSRPSFRDRFWAASSSNNFGSDADNQDASSPAPAKAATPRTAYVPRHAASDFSETAVSRRHRRAVSHDSAVRSPPRATMMPVLAEQTTVLPALVEQRAGGERMQQGQPHTNSFDARGRGPGSQYEHMAHRGASFHARASAAAAFAYASPQPQAQGPRQNQKEPPPQRQHGPREEDEEDELDEKKPQRRPAPPPPVVAEEGQFTDYDRFMARAHAEEMAMRVDAVRRSWREGKRDSACYSGKRGSARTSEEGSGAGDEVPIVSPGPAAVPGLRRQSSVAQKIAEYIRPSREEGVPRYERPASRMGVVREV